MYYLQSRYYDSELGRFISADSYAVTYASASGANMFAYCMNSPVMDVDHSGHFSWGIVLLLALGAAVGGYLGYNSEVKIGESAQKSNDTLIQNQKPSQLPIIDPYTEQQAQKRVPQITNDGETLSESAVNNIQDTSLTTWDRAKNTIVGATLGVFTAGTAISVYGAAVAVATCSMYTAVPLMGGNAIQTFARGALVYNGFPIFVAPFMGLEMEPIELFP